MLLLTNSLILFAVGILLLRSLWSLAMNTTTIESWEIERHKVLLRRAKALGGYLDGPDGTKIRITKQEFPYDIGIWSKDCAGGDHFLGKESHVRIIRQSRFSSVSNVVFVSVSSGSQFLHSRRLRPRCAG